MSKILLLIMLGFVSLFGLDNETNTSVNNSEIDIITSVNDSETSSNNSNEQNTNIVKLWKTNFEVGTQILSDYDEDGTSNGFDHSRLYAEILINSRYTDTNNTLDKDNSIFDMGIKIKLLGTSIKQETNTTKTKTSFDTMSFNDVSETLDVSTYFEYVPSSLRFGLDRNMFSEIGLFLEAGTRSRDTKSKYLDTVDLYGSVGLKYTFFRKNPYVQGVSQTMPDGYFGIYVRQYSDYNGHKNMSRYILEFKYKIVEDGRFLLGAELNQGKEDDEFYMTLTYQYTELLEAFFGVSSIR